MRRILIGMFILLSLANTAIVSTMVPHKDKIALSIPKIEIEENISNMPIVANHPLAKFSSGGTPIEQRDESVRKYLQTGVQIGVPGSAGSGTIVYYDEKENIAYVQSCGHLFNNGNGSMSAEEGKNKNLTCKVITWYHNDKKLASPKKYDAKVIFYSNGTGSDCSLITFKPDWKPEYNPIAPENFNLPTNTQLMSVGCDGANEIAAYDVKTVRLDGGELVTNDNSPRPGRSGGGLLTRDSDMYYVGICVRTTDKTGRGLGLFTPLKTVRSFNSKNGFGWLNEIGISIARKLPIVDRNNQQQEYPKDYIPLPKR